MRLYEVKCDGVLIGHVRAKNKKEAITRVKYYSHWEATIHKKVT